MKLKQKDTDPMDEAYKMVTGDPSLTAVSDAAKGKVPLSDDEQRMKDYKTDERCLDIDEAYAMLFESLSVILRNKELL